MGRPRIEHRLRGGVEQKRCGCCEGWLALTEFARDKSRWDGLQSSCRFCSGRYTRSNREANLEARREYDRVYSQTHKEQKTANRLAWRRENPGRDREAGRRYAERHRHEIREADRARRPLEKERRDAYNHEDYAADPARGIAQARQWKRDNPRQAAIIGRRARARRRAREAGLPTERWTEEQVIARDGLVCWIRACPVGLRADGSRRDWEIDHLIPIAAEYPDHPGDVLANVAIACCSCNRSKSAKVLP